MASFEAAPSAVEISPAGEYGSDDENVVESDRQLQLFSSFVEESSTLIAIVSAFGENLASEEVYTKLSQMIEKYQEQPQLLDPHLEALVVPPMQLVRDNFGDASFLHRLLKYVYLLTRVRGFKTVVKLFPHEVSDVERTLELLEQQSKPEAQAPWETKYVLLLWLSQILLIPFDLSSLDSALAADDFTNEGSGTLVGRLVGLAKEYLADPSKTRDGAALLLSRLLTRPDVRASHTSQFFEWACGVVTDEKQSIFLTTGTFQALSTIFKLGTRSELAVSLPTLFKPIITYCNSAPPNTLLRKQSVKLVQRIGLVLLPPRVAAWRYQRGNRSLLENLTTSTKSEGLATQVSGEAAETADDDVDVPEEVEDVIEQLLNGLRDKDTIVRWSAAKGLGRITNRLPLQLGDDIVGAVLELFTDTEGDAAWHGGCLALAELARRGLLLPSRLGTTIPFVMRALQYDVRRGSHSVGRNVRDAACYVCWAFARAYSSSVMQPFVNTLATGLLITSVFDREVNCRRAASAAFQENVGRQGNFPHGIDILTAADYFTLGIRSNAYLTISVFVAKFDEYRHAFIDHLADNKIRHWDRSLRELSAAALHNLVALDPVYMSDNVLPKLIPLTLSSELSERHGAVLAVGEIVSALHKTSHELSDETKKSVVDVVIKIEKARLYRGRGGEVVRGAVARLLDCIACAELPLSPKMVARLQETINENLKHPTEDIQKAAAAAFSSFARVYYQGKDNAQAVLIKYTGLLATDPNPAMKRGVSMALGVAPAAMLTSCLVLDEVVTALINATEIEEIADDRDAETRRNAVNALVRILRSVGAAAFNKHPGLLTRLYVALVTSVGDYSTDNRGDVGSWVREAAMLALEQYLYVLEEHDKSVSDDNKLLTVDQCTTVFALVLQQAVEKIDKMRDTAGSIFFRLLHSTVASLAHHQEHLAGIVKSDAIVNWAAPGATFPLLVQALPCDAYRYRILLGLCVSAGGLTESLEKHAGTSLVQFCKDGGSTAVIQVANSIIEVLEKHEKVDRVTVPLFKTMDLLLSRGIFDEIPSDSEFFVKLITVCRTEIRGCKDVVKFMASASLFCGLLPFSPASRLAAFQPLLILLVCRYPKVRRMVADSIYTAMLTHETLVGDEIFEDVTTILLETSWDGPVDKVKPRRDELFTLLDVPRPAPSANSKPEPKKRPASAPDESYSALVNEMGY